MTRTHAPAAAARRKAGQVATLLALASLVFAVGCRSEKPAADDKGATPPAERSAETAGTGQAVAPTTAPPGETAPTAVPGIPDSLLGLSKASVFDTPEPPVFVPEHSEPGDEDVLPRAHAKAPPVIPHEIREYLPITRASNPCMECHESDAKPIPPSHKTDLRNAPDAPGEKLVGARHNCLACHVSRTDAAPLVVNNFASGR